MVQIRRSKGSDISTIPELTPKRDAELLRLMDGAARGRVPVYFAAVPFALCVPFDQDYRPDQHPVGQQAIREFAAAWEKGNFQHLIVYQRGAWFVVSDDYIALFAAMTGLPDYLPCWVIGKPDSEFVKDVQGPL